VARRDAIHTKRHLANEVTMLRMYQNLTQKELADMAGVSLGDVKLLENGLPVRLDTKLKIVSKLWAREREQANSRGVKEDHNWTIR